MPSFLPPTLFSPSPSLPSSSISPTSSLFQLSMSPKTLTASLLFPPVPSHLQLQFGKHRIPKLGCQKCPENCCSLPPPISHSPTIPPPARRNLHTLGTTPAPAQRNGGKPARARTRAGSDCLADVMPGRSRMPGHESDQCMAARRKERPGGGAPGAILTIPTFSCLNHAVWSGQRRSLHCSTQLSTSRLEFHS